MTEKEIVKRRLNWPPAKDGSSAADLSPSRRTPPVLEFLEFLGFVVLGAPSRGCFAGSFFSHASSAFRLKRLRGELSQLAPLAFGLDGFGGALFAVLLRMNPELMPVRFRKVDVVMPRGFFDIRERQSSILVRDAQHLVESRNRVSHVLGIRQRLFSLLRKSENRVRQVAAGCEVAVFLVRLPSWL